MYRGNERIYKLLSQCLQVAWTCILSKTAADKPQRAVAAGPAVVPLCVEHQSEDPLSTLALQNVAAQAAAV
jgi:hypothetical protein